MIEDAIVIAVIFLIIGVAGFYIIRQKKRGAKCIGCPMAGSCGKKSGNEANSCCDCDGTLQDK